MKDVDFREVKNISGNLFKARDAGGYSHANIIQLYAWSMMLKLVVRQKHLKGPQTG